MPIIVENHFHDLLGKFGYQDHSEPNSKKKLYKHPDGHKVHLDDKGWTFEHRRGGATVGLHPKSLQDELKRYHK